jgi:hypothetical protein
MKKLERAYLKNLKGGLLESEPPPGGSCAVQWYPGHGSGSFDFSNSPNPVTLTLDNNAGTSTFTGLTYQQAQSLLANGGRWCCASCSTASWLNPS